MVLRCKRCINSYILTDITYGHSVCTKCGLVIETKIISEEKEWRSFKDDDSAAQRDRINIMKVNDLNDPTKFSCSSFNPKLDQIINSDPEKRSNQLCSLAKGLGQSLELNTNVMNLTQTILSYYSNNEKTVFKNFEAFALAAIYIASEQVGSPISIKELSKLGNSTIPQINKACTKLLRIAKSVIPYTSGSVKVSSSYSKFGKNGETNEVSNPTQGNITIGYIKRIITKLNLSPKVLTLALEIFNRIDGSRIVEGRRSTTKAAVCVTIALAFHYNEKIVGKDRNSMKDKSSNGILTDERTEEIYLEQISLVSGIGKQTIVTLVKILIPVFEDLFNGLGNLEEVKNKLFEILAK